MLQSALWNPLQGKPRYQYRPRLNPGNPINNALLASFLFNEYAGNAYSVVNKSHYVAPTSQSLWGDRGMIFNANGEGAELTCPAGLRINPPITIACRIVSIGTPANGSSIFGVSYNNTDSSPYISYAINNNSTAKITLYYNSEGTFTTVSSTTVLTAGVTSVIVAIIKNGYQKLYLNNIEIASATNAVTTINYHSTALLYSGNHTGFSRNSNMVFMGGDIWNRELTLGEINLYTALPYGTPSNPRLIVEPRYAPWVSVGTTPPVETNLSQMMMMGMG